MFRIASVPIIVILVAVSPAQANDGSHCLELVQSQRIEAAHAACRNLDLGNPDAAEAYAFYQQYGVVGRKRLQIIAVRGIDAATPEERRTLESSRKHLLFAAEAGMPAAPMLLAMTIGLFERPEIDVDSGIIRYNEEQTYWFEKAAELGWPEANYQLGIRALSSLGTLLVRPEYLPYLERAAELDHADAAALLRKYKIAAGLAATESTDDAEVLREHAIELWVHADGDKREAIELVRRLADAGDEKAMLMAGQWAWSDDPEAARSYLQQAAKAGSNEAMMALGNWHACKGDAEEAGRWFREALAREHPEARYALNDLAEWGIGEWECRYL